VTFTNIDVNKIINFIQVAEFFFKKGGKNTKNEMID